MSNFVVSARKYRPQRFDEVVGQEHVTQTLKNALQTDHLAHAFLFCGPRGVGKTTCARILAKVINCQNLGVDHEACDACNSCRAFNENASFNIIELDAASNNSVEHIRALIEQVRFQPQQGKYKVFIIDEVHMLSQQAFNAFLKTLEEPPPYAIFILATTEKHKIIPTILSRCQIFDFRRIQPQAMVKHLQEICQQEGIKADEDALHIIAIKADGALRDSLSIFDRMISFGGKKLNYDDVITNLNVLDYDYFFKVVDMLLQEDVGSVLLLLDDVLKKGFDADHFIQGLAEHLRNLLVSKDASTVALLELSEGLKVRYLEQARLTPSSFILTSLNLANECDINYKMARNKRLHVEMALIKMSFVNRAVQLAQQPVTDAPPSEKKTPERKEDRRPRIEEGKKKMERSDIPNLPRDRKEKIEEGRLKPKEDENDVENNQSPHVKQEVTSTNAIPPKAGLKKSSKHSMPKLMSLDAMEDQVKEEMSATPVALPDLKEEEIKSVLTAYSEEITSPTARTSLQSADVLIEKEEITLRVGLKISKELLQKELGLMDYLRKKLNHPGLILKVEVDESKQPKKKEKPKVLSLKEKYLLMREVNPLVDDLRKNFDLFPDED
jgi:DNA polymerase-3 subunit gamma/tau